MEWIAIVLAVWLVGSVAKRLITAAEKRRQERIDLQFWDADLAPGETEVGSDIQVHFPSMLMKSTFWSVAGGDSLRLFHVRRKGDATWETKMTSESYDMEYRERRHRVECGSVAYTKADLEKFEKAGLEWQPIDAEHGSLETAYQRFIHAQNVPITAAEVHWREREGEQAAKETTRHAQEKANLNVSAG
jgi:hypothetical protein